MNLMLEHRDAAWWYERHRNLVKLASVKRRQLASAGRKRIEQLSREVREADMASAYAKGVLDALVQANKQAEAKLLRATAQITHYDEEAEQKAREAEQGEKAFDPSKNPFLGESEGGEA